MKFHESHAAVYDIIHNGFLEFIAHVSVRGHSTFLDWFGAAPPQRVIIRRSGVTYRASDVKRSLQSVPLKTL